MSNGEDFIKTAATEFLENHAVELVSNFGDMLKSLSPKQKEFTYTMAIIKATNISELTLEESVELGEVLNRASELNMEISEEVAAFWNKIGEIAAAASLKFAEFGIKIAARALIGFLPI